MKLNKYLEFVNSDLEPIKSFRIKDELDPKVWDNFEIDDEVRRQLLQIGEDFFDDVDIEADVQDIILCGSLCGYNWSNYSDYDIHVIVKHSDIDENKELVEKFCDYAKKTWNSQHDIIIKGYEVEIMLQDLDDLREGIDSGKIGGAYSLLKDKWLKKPEKVNFIPDEETIKEKAKVIMMTIDEIEDEASEDKYEAFKEKIDKVWAKIKNSRKSGLDSEGGEYSTGNLVFKLLRRNGYVSRVMDLKRKVYDKQFN